uniref:RxLR effector candidate protein n=1 Tax=Hyaloperonospora arabidopsidis (strain Emoy2) TaxID=559515 RepID=M4C2L3_HYAAE
MASRIIKSEQGIGLRLDNSTCSMLGETRKRCRTLWDELVADWIGEQASRQRQHHSV